MKAVILAAGKGKRLQPLTAYKPKHLLPVAGKPMLDHILSAAAASGVKDALIVVKHMKEQIIEKYSSHKLDLNINFAEQEEFLGTANAISISEDFIGKDDFIVINGDVLTNPSEIKALINTHQKNKPFSTLGVKEVPYPNQYGVVEVADGKVKKIIEKPSPSETKSNLISVGIMCFKKDVFDIIRQTPLSPRGEYEVTKSIQIAVSKKETVLPYEIKSWWVDVGRPWDLLEANQYLISEVSEVNSGVIEENAHLKGQVIVRKGAVIRSGAYIEGPVIVDEDSDIGPNCYIRAATYIGKRVRIGNACEIKNSIILDGTHIGHLSYVGDSIIGSNVNFGAGTKIANLRFDSNPIKMNINGVKIDSGRRKLGAVIGDNVKTGIGVNIAPGVKIGQDSAIAPNVTVWGDIPPGKLLNVKLEYDLTEWKPH